MPVQPRDRAHGSGHVVALLRGYAALMRTNLRSSMALRVAFVMQSVFMALNNALFFVIWWVLFERFEEIRGWRLDDFAALYGIAAAGYGLSVIFAGGVPDLAQRIEDGDLDAMLTLPQSVLVQAAAATTRPAGWGDLVSGIALIALGGHLSAWVILAAVLSAVTFTASGVVLHSAGFWVRRMETLSRQAQEFVLAFSLYPPSLFGSTLKLFLFTVIPAGFASYLPAEIIRAPTAITVASAVVGTLLYAVFATWLFARGLRQYASGNRFGVRQ